jgi:hypothetical protein
MWAYATLAAIYRQHGTVNIKAKPTAARARWAKARAKKKLSD